MLATDDFGTPQAGNEPLDRLDELLSLLLDDSLDSDSLEEVEQRLFADADARRRYLDLTRLDCDLRELFARQRVSEGEDAGIASRGLQAVFGRDDATQAAGG